MPIGNIGEKIKDNAIIGAVMFMLSIGGLFLWNRGVMLWELPDTVKRLENLHKIDSLEHFRDLHKQDSINKMYHKWFDDDYINIDSLKKVIKKPHR